MKKNERFVAYGGCYGLLLLAAFYYSLSGRDISAAVLYLFLLCGVWIKC